MSVFTNVVIFNCLYLNRRLYLSFDPGLTSIELTKRYFQLVGDRPPAKIPVPVPLSRSKTNEELDVRNYTRLVDFAIMEGQQLFLCEYITNYNCSFSFANLFVFLFKGCSWFAMKQIMNVPNVGILFFLLKNRLIVIDARTLKACSH